MSNTFIAVEGQHDVEFVCGLLEAEGFQKVLLVERLDEAFGRRIIDTKFPHEGDLHKRVPNPMFLRRNADWAAVQAAGGETPHLVKRVRTMMNALRPFPGALSAIGIVRDADDLQAPQQFAAMLEEIRTIGAIEGYTVTVPANPGDITPGPPRFGIFVSPDNSGNGTVEDLLLECGQTVYPDLIQGAQVYVDNVDYGQLHDRDKELISKPSGKKKAVLACAASILKPGMSIAASIDQNRWLNEQARLLVRIKAVTEFLKNLCGIA